jgi:TonB family protein
LKSSRLFYNRKVNARACIIAAACLAAPWAAPARAAAADDAVAVVKSWRDQGYYMDLGHAAENLLLGFEAQGKSVQRVGWFAEETIPGHFDVRYTFLLDAASAEMIFLLDWDEGRVSMGNELARAVATLAATVDVGEEPAAKPRSVITGERTADDIQAEIEVKKRELESVYEDFLNRAPSASGKLKVRFTILASGGVAGVEVVESTINYQPLSVSLVRAIERWTFSPAASDVTLTYPFVFYSKM